MFLMMENEIKEIESNEIKKILECDVIDIFEIKYNENLYKLSKHYKQIVINVFNDVTELFEVYKELKKIFSTDIFKNTYKNMVKLKNELYVNITIDLNFNAEISDEKIVSENKFKYVYVIDGNGDYKKIMAVDINNYYKHPSSYEFNHLVEKYLKDKFDVKETILISYDEENFKIRYSSFINSIDCVMFKLDELIKPLIDKYPEKFI